MGLHVVAQAPEKYHAVMLTGVATAEDAKTQASCMDWLNTEARQRGDTETLSYLSELEPDEQGVIACPLEIVAEYGGSLYSKTRINEPVFAEGLRSSEYRPLDYWRLIQGMVGENRDLMVTDMIAYGEIPELIPDLDLPVFFFLGRHDYQTPSQVAANYFERLDTPKKELLWFEQSGHMPFWEEPDKFFQAVKQAATN